MSIEIPLENDVLFGRDSDSWNHAGNQKFRIAVARYQDEYHATEARSTKVAIVATIVHELKEAGARFLKRDPQTKLWHEVDRKSVIEKVGHAIRDRQIIAQRKLHKIREEAFVPSVEQPKTIAKPQVDASLQRLSMLAAAEHRNSHNLNESMILRSMLAQQAAEQEQRLIPNLFLAQSLAAGRAMGDASLNAMLPRAPHIQRAQYQALSMTRQMTAGLEALSAQQGERIQSATGMGFHRSLCVRNSAEELLFDTARRRRDLLTAMINEQNMKMSMLRSNTLSQEGRINPQHFGAFQIRRNYDSMHHPQSIASLMLAASGTERMPSDLRASKISDHDDSSPKNKAETTGAKSKASTTPSSKKNKNKK